MAPDDEDDRYVPIRDEYGAFTGYYRDRETGEVVTLADEWDD